MKWKNAIINKELISDILSPEKKIDTIKTVISDYFNISWEVISKKGRQGERVLPKQLFMYFARELTKDYFPRTSLSNISDHLEGEKGKLTHSTILRAIEMLDNLQVYDKDLILKIELIRNIILEKFEEQRKLIKFTE